MHRGFSSLAFTVASLSITAGAASLCEELRPKELSGRWVLAPTKCDSQSQAACERMTKDLLECLTKAEISVATEAGVNAAGGEQLFQQMAMGASSEQLSTFADQVHAKYLALLEVTHTASGEFGLLRVLNAQDGTVARLVRQRAAGQKDAAVEATVSEALEGLAQKLATAFLALGQEARGKRLAVVGFSEQGELSKKSSLGTLVSAELTTRFKRDYGFSIVERSRLDQVIKELELGQSGLVDDKLAPKLGKLLDAGVVVLGSVTDAGSTIIIHAQVVDTTTGLTLVANSASVKSASMIALSSDAVVLRSKSGAVFRSLLIPGWGQFYNQQSVKGGALLASAGGLGLGAIACELLTVSAQNTYDRARANANFDQLYDNIQNFATARDVLIGVLAAVWIYNIIDAYAFGVTFDSAVESRVNGSASLSLTPAGLYARF